MKTSHRLTVITLLLAVSDLAAATHYVSLESANPTPPYTNWITAATNIQDAVDAAEAGDTVLVTNGVYAVGSRDVSVLDTNLQPPALVSLGLSRIAVTNSIRLGSVNGPLATTIDGGGSVRCVYLGSNAVLSGFALTNGFAPWGDGGGVYCQSTNGFLTNCGIVDSMAGYRGGGANGGTLSHCTLIGNRAWNSDKSWPGSSLGGGGYGCTLYDCTLTDNDATAFGGGAYGCVLYNSTVSRNSTGYVGGGAEACTIYNCAVTGNWALFGGGVSSSVLYNCTLTGNEASVGGGADFSRLYNCTVTGNEASHFAGGADGSTLYNCTVTGNSGGGVIGYSENDRSTVFNSIVYYNAGGNYGTNATLNYCCTSPLPTNGVGNITDPPLFMDWYAGDFRLREESPCIDAGRNLVGLAIVPIRIYTNGSSQTILVPYTYEPTDILGNTRFIDGNFDGIVAWDIGAYEFNSFPPPRFTRAPQLTASGWQLNITGAPNKWVRVQTSTDLQHWWDLYSSIWMGPEGVKQVNDWNMDQRMMFYRVVVE